MSTFRPAPGPALLIDLITNTADPGYAAAAERRRRLGIATARSWYEQPLAAVGAVLVGLTLALAYLHTNRAAPATAKLHADLVARVRAAQSQNDALQRQLTSTQKQIDDLRNQVLPAAGQLRQTLALQQLLAGQTAVSGQGLQVTLTVNQSATPTPAARAGVTPVQAVSSLTDKDIRSVVNELWNDGAEAIAINGIRLTPLSAIRFAGEAVLVDFQPINSPYVVMAIGNSDTLVTAFADSEVATRYHTQAALGRISFGWSQQKRLDLAAGSAVTLNYARTVPSPTPVPSPTATAVPTRSSNISSGLSPRASSSSLPASATPRGSSTTGGHH